MQTHFVKITSLIINNQLNSSYFILYIELTIDNPGPIPGSNNEKTIP